MAVQTLYLLGTAGTAPNYWGNIQVNGTAPTAANSAQGWRPGTTALSTPYYRGRLGSTAVATVAQAASYNAAATGPTPGTGTGAAASGDSFVAGPWYGNFAATAWTFNCNLRASTAGCVGHINLRVWHGPNLNGSGAVQVLANTAGATVTLSTTADTNSSVTWSPGALSLLAGEYLFFQIEWQETTLGTGTNANVLFRIGTAAITTPDYQPIANGTLAATQGAQTIAAAGGGTIRGGLTAPQGSQTLAGHASNYPPYGRFAYGMGPYDAPIYPAGANLQLTQADQTLAAAADAQILGQLGQVQASQTLVAAGRVVAGASLAVTQANQTLAAAGTVRVGATLVQTQAPQTLQASGGSVVAGHLAVTQAAQTLSATGAVFAGFNGALHVTQADQTLVAAGVVRVGASLSITQAPQTLIAYAASTVSGHLSLTQANQTLAAHGTVAWHANLALTQDSQTLEATGVLNVFGALSVTQDDQRLEGYARADWGAWLPVVVEPGTWPEAEPCLVGAWMPPAPCTPSQWPLTTVPAGAWQPADTCSPGTWQPRKLAA